MGYSRFYLTKLSLRKNEINNSKAEKMILGLRKANLRISEQHTSKSFLDLADIDLADNKMTFDMICQVKYNFLLTFSNNRTEFVFEDD